jgi:hypothetical protein
VFITAHQRSLSSARSIQSYSYSLKIHFNIILPSTSGSSQCSFPSGFQMNILYVELICPTLSTCPAHLLHPDLIIIFCEEYKLCSFSLSCFLQPPVTLLLLDPNIFLSILFKHHASVRASMRNKRCEITNDKIYGTVIMQISDWDRS